MGRLGFLLYHMAMLDFRISIYIYIILPLYIYHSHYHFFLGDWWFAEHFFFPAWFVPTMWEACRFGALEDIGEMALSRMRHD